MSSGSIFNLKNVVLVGISYWTLTTLTTIKEVRWKYETNEECIKALVKSAKPVVETIDKIINEKISK